MTSGGPGGDDADHFVIFAISMYDHGDHDVLNPSDGMPAWFTIRDTFDEGDV